MPNKPVTIELTQIREDLTYIRDKVNKIHERMNEYDAGFVRIISNATINERRIDRELQTLKKRVYVLYGLVALVIVILGVVKWMGLV